MGTREERRGAGRAKEDRGNASCAGEEMDVEKEVMEEKVKEKMDVE